MSFPLAIPRLFQAMQSGAAKETKEWAEIAHMSPKYARAVLPILHECGLARIGAWRRKHSTSSIALDWVPLWVAGQGPNKKRPAPMDNALVQRNRYKRLKEMHGVKRANQILKPRGKGGVTDIMEEGHLRYKRGAPRGRNNINKQGVPA